MNYTVNLTNSFVYTGGECMQWCSYQMQHVENTLFGGTIIMISVLTMGVAFILMAIKKEHLTHLGLVKPKDAYAREVTLHKLASALIDSSFLMQIAFLIAYAIKGMGWF